MENKNKFMALMAKQVILLFFVTFFTCGHAGAEDTARAIIFQDADAAFEQAKSSQGELFAPEHFEDAVDNYRDAEEYFKKGKRISSINEYLKKAVDNFNKTIEISRRASELFSKSLAAKYDALNVGADKYDSRTWEDAETILKDAIEENEDNDIKNAKVYATKSETLFRQAELTTIKISHLQKVWKKLEKLDDMGSRNYAPNTFLKAKKIAKQVEIELEKQPYGNDQARELVKEADYEAEHALYLSGLIADLHNKDITFEYIINSMENHVSSISTELGITPRYDKGLKGPVKSIIDEIKEYKKNQTINEAKIRAMKAEINELNLTEEELRVRQRKAEQELKNKKEILLRQKIKNQKIQKISASFTSEEGKVLMHGENIIIRLYGVTFPSGKSVIDYKYFALLSKVRNTFAEFPGCKVIIEGHTDSVGSDSVNQTLSMERAEAVRQYILANSKIDSKRIKAVGYGESKPIASNESKFSQAKNRRIDVIIIPSYQAD